MTQATGTSGQRMGDRGQGAIARPSETLARRLAPPGRLRKRLRVPDRHVAIALAEAGPYTLGPGDHSLANWPAPAPEIILLRTGPLPLELQWDGLPAGDGEPVRARVSAEVSVTAPLQLHETWLRLSPGPEWLLPTDAIAGRLHDLLADSISTYAAADLNRPPVRDALVRALRGPLESELARYGLALTTPTLALRTAGLTAQKAAADMARSAAALAQTTRIADVVAELDTLDEFRDRIATWQAETGETLDEETVDLLWHRVAPDGIPLRRPEAVKSALTDAAADLSAGATGIDEPLSAARRQDQMQSRVGADADPLPDLPSRRLNRIYSILRLGAATIGCAWATRSVLSNGFAQADVAGLVLEGIGLVVAVVGVSAAAVTYAQAQKQAKPYWEAVRERFKGLPAEAALDEVRAHARRMYLVADVLMAAALAGGLLLWLDGHPPALLALPVLAFAVAFGLVLIARGRERQARRQVDALLQQMTRPGLQQRRMADDLVRRKVREYLARGQTNLEEAGSTLFRLGPDGQQVTAALRRLRTGPLAKLQDETQAVHYRDARYFAEIWVPDAQVTQMLDLDDDLLRRARKVALDSEALYAASVDSSTARCAEATAALDKDINQLRRVMGERSAFIEQS